MLLHIINNLSSACTKEENKSMTYYLPLINPHCTYVHYFKKWEIYKFIDGNFPSKREDPMVKVRNLEAFKFLSFQAFKKLLNFYYKLLREYYLDFTDPQKFLEFREFVNLNGKNKWYIISTYLYWNTAFSVMLYYECNNYEWNYKLE